MTLSIRYFGHSAFLLESDGKSVLIDPFMSANPACETNPDDVNPETILLSHAHNDHVGDTVSIAKRTGAQVIATFELGVWLQNQGVNAVPANHGGTVAFDGGTVKFTPAWHTSSYEDGDQFVAPGVPAGLVIRFGGQTVYFAGDTCLFLDMQLIGDEELDVAIIPIGDHFTMGPKDAVKAARMLRAGKLIPCHYNTFPPIEQDAPAFKADVESEMGTVVLPMKPGESIEA